MTSNTEQQTENQINNHNQQRLSIPLWSGAGLLLLIPLIAMQFTQEVNWGLADFVIFGILLSAVCGSYELAKRLTGNHTYRIAVALALMATFLIIWINLAVGIIGEPRNLANLMYVGVLAVGIIGSLIVRFQPRGMSHALFATAFAIALVAIGVFFGNWESSSPKPWAILLMHGVFIALFIASALLFRKAAND